LRAVANRSLLDFPPSILADWAEPVISLREQPFQRILLFIFTDFIDPLSPVSTALGQFKTGSNSWHQTIRTHFTINSLYLMLHIKLIFNSL